MQSRDPFSQPSLYSLSAETNLPTKDANATYDFQMTVFIGDSPNPVFDQTFYNKHPAKDGTYLTTYATPDHRMWGQKLRVFITDLTNYRGAQPLLRLRLDNLVSPGAPSVMSTPFIFSTREFKHSDQRTIKVDLDMVYRMELHFAI